MRVKHKASRCKVVVTHLKQTKKATRGLQFVETTVTTSRAQDSLYRYLNLLGTPHAARRAPHMRQAGQATGGQPSGRDERVFNGERSGRSENN
jgi:hypothetical protein